MTWNLMFFVNSVLLGVGLAMDAFSVSMANGLAEPEMKRSKTNLIAGTFGFFQIFMPLVGWFCVHTLVSYFKVFEKFIPWIALILLLYIGGKMLIESISNMRKGKSGEEIEVTKVNFGILIVQGIATAIDALSVGFTIASYNLVMALVCAGIIGVVTFFISKVGLKIGKIFGMKLADKAGLLGGTILIIIGLEIFIRGVFL